MDALSLTKAEPEQDADFVLTTPLSRSVLEGRAVTQDHVVIERPEFRCVKILTSLAIVERNRQDQLMTGSTAMS